MNFEQLGIDLKGRTAGVFYTTCPRCSESRKKKSAKCLTVNISDGWYKCHHGDCNFKGSVKKDERKAQQKEKEYKVPEINNTQLGDDALAWFNNERKISKATVIRWNITEGDIYFPQLEKKRNAIHFNYYEDGKLVNVKYRDGAKNFRLAGGAKLVFYGLDFIKDVDWCIITEGEIDALSMYEAASYPVVSVPNGVSDKGESKLEYLDNCWQHFEDKKKIFLAIDNDAAGLKLREELARRLGKERCFIVNYPEDCKDANEVLVKHGPQKLIDCVVYSEPWPLDGILTIKTEEEKFLDLYQNGFKSGAKCGYNEFDRLISFRTGEFTIVTGAPGSGKSTFIDQLMVLLGKVHKWKFGIFSPENQPVALHMALLSEKFIGKSFFSTNFEYKMTSDEAYQAKLFLEERFFFVSLDNDNLTIDGILDKAKELVLRKGINFFLIDPYNYVEHKIPKGYSETQYVSEFLTKIKLFKERYNVHIMLVAHPTKLKKESDGRYEVPTLYHISGSAHFFNKADNGFVVWRDFENNEVEVHVQKIRFKFVGQIGAVKFEFDRFTGTYREKNSFTPPPETLKVPDFVNQQPQENEEEEVPF